MDSLLPRQSNEPVRGDIRIQLMYFKMEVINILGSHRQPKSLSATDFELLKVVGKGSFGKVLQVRKKDTGRIFLLSKLARPHLCHESTRQEGHC